MGGNSPQSLVNHAASPSSAATPTSSLLGGAEAWRTRMGARAAGVELDWTVQGDDVPEAPRSIGEVPMSAPGEKARGVVMPVQVYPLFEQAPPRRRSGATLDEHLVADVRAVGRLQRGGGHQPARVDPARRTRAEEIRTPTPGQPDDRVPVHEAA